jgi:hypothetical protein
MRKTIALAALTLLASTAYAASDVYRWKDASGIWHYSDQPHPGAELVRNGRAASASPAAPAQPQTPAPAAPQATSNEPLPVSKEAAAEVRQEAATAQAKQCEKSTKFYNDIVQARRVTKTDDKGNKTYMSNAEIDGARLQARAARDLACGS